MIGRHAGTHVVSRTARTKMTTRSKAPAAAAMAMLVLAMLAACSSTVVRSPGATSAPKVSTPKPGASVVVQRGDTLYRLAVNNGIIIHILA